MMPPVKRTGSDGKEYTLVLLEPEPYDDDSYRCELVVTVDGIEKERRSTYGIDAQQARQLASRLLEVYLEGLP